VGRVAMKQLGAYLTALLTTLLTLAAAVGQNDPGVVKAPIPFSFVMAGRTLPPGRYVLSTLGEQTVRVASSHNQSAFAMTSRLDARSPAASGKLVFHRYQNIYFLAQIWHAGRSQGKQVFKSPIEEDLERKGARLEIVVLRTD
jgi:hypothetical protein